MDVPRNTILTLLLLATIAVAGAAANIAGAWHRHATTAIPDDMLVTDTMDGNDTMLAFVHR